jgi:hypothetical protein
MFLLYNDLSSAFRLADNPIIPRFYMDGVERRVMVDKMAQAPGGRLARPG